MRRFLLAGFTVAVLTAGTAMSGTSISGTALAADLSARQYRPPPPPPPPPPIYIWTGFYVGAGGGYGLWDIDTSFAVPAAGIASSVTNNGGRGWIGQAVAGYDYQFSLYSYSLVAGVFGDYDFGHITGTMNVGLANAIGNTLGGGENEPWYWAVGGRIGWLVNPQILTYWNGGYTQAHFDGINLTGTGSGPAFAPMSVGSNTYHGWFTGGGVETQVTFIPGLFFNTEYRFSSYSSATLPINNATAEFGTPVSLKFEPHVQTVMSGLRYKFNWTP